MSPVPYTWGPFLAKIFLKIDEIKIRPLTPPQNHFNTLPVLVADACIQEGWEKLKRVRPLNGTPETIIPQCQPHHFNETKKWLICIFGLRPCSGGVISENWTIF